jgi:hypothetical protein
MVKILTSATGILFPLTFCEFDGIDFEVTLADVEKVQAETKPFAKKIANYLTPANPRPRVK